MAASDDERREVAKQARVELLEHLIALAEDAKADLWKMLFAEISARLSLDETTLAEAIGWTMEDFRQAHGDGIFGWTLQPVGRLADLLRVTKED